VPDRREQRFGAAQQCAEFGLGEPVVVRSAMRAVDDKPAIFETGQMAGDVGLRAAKVADEAHLQRKKDAQSGRVGQAAEQLGC
jgi:hypothetical protein